MEKFKVKIFALLLLVSSIGPVQALIVVSDLDDTIKITNTRSFRAAAYNSFFNTTAYAGMPELMNEMASYTNALFYVSASPKIVNSRIRKFFNVNDLKVSGFYTRSLSQLGDKVKFKINAITDILNTTEEDVILMGDDSELDPEVYVKIQELFPNRVQAVYIHNVYNAEKKTEANSYFTAFDIAVSEYLDQRMDFAQVTTIATDILFEKDLSKYIPSFAHCPSTMEEFSKNPLSKLSPMILAVNAKIITYCKLRLSID